MEKASIRLIKYNKDNYSTIELSEIGEVYSFLDDLSVCWINIDGLHDISLFQDVASHFNFSSLALEDILNTDQRPKYFEDSDSLSLITKAIYYDKENRSISVEQISFILGRNFLISFQERTGDHFDPVRERLRQNISRIRLSGADYLMYTLLDSLIDNYLMNIEAIGAETERIEPRLRNPGKEISEEIFHLKKEIVYLRKMIGPHKELLTKLLRSNSSKIEPDILVYFQELYDLIVQAQEACDNYFNLIVDQMNMYNITISTKANEVMKVLTIFASIFIPLTFLAGVYGTNFENLPELHFRYGYYIMWAIMVVVAGSMMIYFRKRKWF